MHITCQTLLIVGCYWPAHHRTACAALCLAATCPCIVAACFRRARPSPGPPAPGLPVLSPAFVAPVLITSSPRVCGLHGAFPPSPPEPQTYVLAAVVWCLASLAAAASPHRKVQGASRV